MGRRVRGCRVRGPLAPWQAGFEGWLLGRGYLPSAVFHRCCLLAALSLWLEQQGMGASELTSERAALFVAERRAAGLKTWASERSVRLPLEYLREVGAIAAAVEVLDHGPVAQVLAGYREYLCSSAASRSRTIDGYQRTARLVPRAAPDGLEMERLTAADVSGFSRARVPAPDRIAGARSLLSNLRPLLALSACRGADRDAAGVGGAGGRRACATGRCRAGWTPRSSLGCWRSCDRRRTVGRRDYAIVLLLVRLGLRAGEVAAIELQDLDWRRGRS